MKLILTLIFSLWLLSISDSYACTCFGTTNIDSAFIRADIIFSGQVDETLEGFIYAGQNEMLDSELVNFRVLKGYKSAKENSVPVTFMSHKTSCDIEFEEKEEFIVFGYRGNDGIYYTNFCTRTALKEKFNKEDLKRLELLSARFDENKIPDELFEVDPATLDKMDLTINELKASNKDLHKDKELFKYLLLSAGLVIAVLIYLLIKK